MSVLGLTLILAIALVPSNAAHAGVVRTASHGKSAMVAAVQATTATVADVAAAASTFARPGEGVIRITSRVCGNANNWRNVAAANGIRPPTYLVLLGQRLSVACAGGSSAPAPAPAPATATGRAAQIVNYALAQVGKPYRWAAAGPYAYDCSGLVMMALRQVGISVPHQDGWILNANQGWRVSRSDLRPGDLVWPHAGHVAIYLGNGRIVHAAGYRYGVITGTLYSFMAAKRYV